MPERDNNTPIPNISSHKKKIVNEETKKGLTTITNTITKINMDVDIVSNSSNMSSIMQPPVSTDINSIPSADTLLQVTLISTDSDNTTESILDHLQSEDKETAHDVIIQGQRKAIGEVRIFDDWSIDEGEFLFIA